MKCTKNSYLMTLSLVMLLSTSPAVAGPKSSMSIKNSTMNRVRSMQSSSTAGALQSNGTSRTLLKSNATTSALKFSQGSALTTGANSTSVPKFKAQRLNSSVLSQFQNGQSNGTGLSTKPLSSIDTSKLGSVLNNRITTGAGSAAGTIKKLDRNLIGAFDPSKLSGATTNLGIRGPGAVLNPGLVNSHPIFDPAHPPVFDPGDGGVDPPADPPADPPVDPGNGGGDPPAEPPVDPPVDPNPGDPNCPPQCPPDNHGNHCWPFPIPFPVWGGYNGGCYNGGYYGGTTVVQPVITQAVAVEPAAQPIDLELVEVRQIDRGDVTKDMGPAYRVTIRNKSGEAVVQQFNVSLAASIGRQATAEAAFATVRVNGLQAGQLLAVEVRLPATAYNLGLNADGQPVPFTWLTAVADSHQELPEANRENDFTTLSRSEIVMVSAK